jgi:hypothetical protein
MHPTHSPAQFLVRRRTLIPLFLLLGFIILAGLWWYTSQQTTANLDTVPPNPNGDRILYILDDQNPPSAITPRIREIFTPKEEQGWAFIASFSPNTLIDMIIIDGSVPSEKITREWLTQMYDNGVAITFLDKYASEVAVLVDDPSIKEDGFASEPYPGHFYVSVLRIIECHPEDAAEIIENIESGSDETITTSRQCSTSGRRATESLEVTHGFEALEQVVRSSSQSVQQSRQQ